MSYESRVEVKSLSFGTAGTSTLVLSSATNTSNPYVLPRAPYTVSVSAMTTGTSIGSAVVVWQGSNDNLGWVPLGSATVLSTNASTGTSANAAAVNVSNLTPYAYGRGIVSSTGTGWAAPHFAS